MTRLSELGPYFVAAAIAGGLVLFILSAMRLRWALATVALMIFATSMGSGVNQLTGATFKTWLYPLQLQRSLIFMCGGVLLGLTAAMHFRRLQLRNVAPQAAVLLMMGAVTGMMRILHEDAADGVSSVAMAVATILPLMLVVPALLEDREAWIRMFRMIAGVAVIWTLAVGVQYLINPSVLSKGFLFSRYNGLFENAQHTASYLAVSTVCVLWLVLNDPRRTVRLFMTAFTGVLLAQLVWTGSRTGMGMFTLAAMAMLVTRLQKAVLLVPIVAVTLWAAMEFLGAGETAERLTSLQNTRMGAWANLYQGFAQAPLFGLGMRGAGDSENSYLLALAAFGLIGGALMVALIVVSGVQCLRLLTVRRYLDPQARSMADLVIGYHAMYFGGGVFEGYIMARVNVQIVMLVIFSSMGMALLRQGARARDGGHQLDHGHGGYDGYGDYEDAEEASHEDHAPGA